ncbi:MAG TPA: hypothetical protein P5548_03770 [Candidatus Moranbacteria bacterium]|nr:hypothetical protein [Candidatus Moranbacteria bacterium]HRZ33988.1 hypothetical protein [Candidatus Moranbacteria bacterium]
MKNKNKKEDKNELKKILQGFASNILERFGNNISKKIALFINQLKRRTIGAILLLIGAIFFLTSIAIMVNTFLSDELQWVGWSLVGFVVIIFGYILSKD